MLKYTQKQARADIATGFALDGRELYAIHKQNLVKHLGNYRTVAVGHGIYGVNCILIHSENCGFVAFPTNCTAMYAI